MPTYTLRQLAYLVTASDAGSVSAAAGQLRVSPSAVADGITDLERAIGARLTVRRRARGLSLTSAGQQVVDEGRDLLRRAEELRFSLRSERDGDIAGPVTIGCYPTLAPVVLPPLLAGFGARHPGVDLTIREYTHDRLAGRLESGEIDVAFMYDNMLPGHPQRARLYELPAHVLLPADHRLALRPAVRLADVIDEDLILYDAPPSLEHTLSLFAEVGLQPRVRHRTGNFEAVRTLVGRGLGYAVLIQRPANPETYEGYRVVVKEITPAVPAIAVSVLWSADRIPPRRVEALVAFARALPWLGSVDRGTVSG